MTRPPAAVWDLDGVLADVRHRLHFVQQRPRDWDAFFAAAGDDPLLASGARLLHTHVEDGLHIVYVSGRPEHCRAATADWLARHGLPAADLLLRGASDFRPARLVKARALQDLSGRFDVRIVVDDDPQVAQELRGAGFPVHLADWMHRAGDAASDATLTGIQEGEGRT